jgi:hypothetical protein
MRCAAIVAVLAGCVLGRPPPRDSGLGIPGAPAPALVDAYDYRAVTRAGCDGSGDAIAIDDALAADAVYARRWNVAWGVTYAATAIGLATAARRLDGLSPATRDGLWLSAGKAAIAAVVRVVKPLSIEPAPPCAEAPAQRTALRHAVRHQRSAVLLNAAGGLVLNTAGMFYLGLRHDAWGKGALSFALGTAVGLAAALTAPSRAWNMRDELTTPGPNVIPIVGRGEVGVGLTTTW